MLFVYMSICSSLSFTLKQHSYSPNQYSQMKLDCDLYRAGYFMPVEGLFFWSLFFIYEARCPFHECLRAVYLFSLDDFALCLLLLLNHLCCDSVSHELVIFSLTAFLPKEQSSFQSEEMFVVKPFVQR